MDDNPFVNMFVNPSNQQQHEQNISSNSIKIENSISNESDQQQHNPEHNGYCEMNVKQEIIEHDEACKDYDNFC